MQDAGLIKPPFLTVIIPAYNAEKYLEDTVLSVLQQPCKDVQIIIVNDGSKDNTLAVANTLAKTHERVKVIDQQNGGGAAARNAGLDFAEKQGTEYIAFLDSDDVWTDGFYDDSLYKHMRKTAKDIYYFGLYYANATLTRGRKNAISGSDDSNGKLQKYGIHCCYLYRHDIIVRHHIRFPVGYKTQEDTTFTFAFCSAVTTWEHIAKEIFLYRSNTLSVSHAKVDPRERYFNHAIPAWKWAEQEVKRITAAVGKDGTSDVGECVTMQKTYLPEFVRVSCQEGLSVRSIRTALNQSGMLGLFENESIWVDDLSKKEWKQFNEHPYIFWFQKRMKGLQIKLGQRVRNISFIQKKRYPTDLSRIYNPL